MKSTSLMWMVLGTACLLASCSLTLNFDECEVDTDCQQIGLGLSCFDGLCVQDGGAQDPNGECLNSQCVQEFGDNFVCGKANICVNALSAQCNTVVGPIEKDNIFLIGSVLPTSGNFGGLGLPIQQAAQLAVEEFNDASGLPNGQRIVMIGCDSAGDGELGLSAVEHLTNSLGVSAIVGPAFSSIFIDGTTAVTVPAGVMTISPSATSPLIAGLDDQGLAWRTVASDVFQGVAIADLVRDLNLTKVTVMNKGDAYGRGLFDRVSEELAAEIGEPNFAVIEYDDPGDGMVDVGRVGDALDEIADPEAVLLLGTSEALDLMLAYENAISDDVRNGIIEPPIYILTDGGKDGDKFQAMINSSLLPDDLVQRIQGTEPDHKNGNHFFNFDLRFKRSNNNQPAGVFTPNAYDAVYLLGYTAIVAGAQGEINGFSLSAAMERLSDPNGSQLSVGPSEVGQARNKLISGDSFNFEGASGPLDFDLAVGEAPANVALWRPSVLDDEVRFDTARSYLIGDDGRGVWSIEPESGDE